jgi:signal transduction histidine kinase/ActR/RegA family two-component response regulator
MSMKPAQLRAEPHNLLGAVIGRDAGVIVEKWARRAVEEEPSAQRVHHDVLLDHLPTFLWDLGKGLSDAADSIRHCRTAGLHGDQRWESGWSIEELVRDYQLLRLVLVEHLHETVGRVLTVHEFLAIGVYFDDAIASSVSAYHTCTATAPQAGAGVKANGARSEEMLTILGVLGHELRNPLAPLGNALQVLKLSGTDPAVVERTRLLMERQHKSLTRLVNDLLDLPRLTQKKMQIRSERLDLCTLVRDAAEDRRSAFDEAGVRFHIQVPAAPMYTLGDPLRLTQVVGNLLGNAAKFTDHGGEVILTLSRSPARPVAHLTIKDTGIGIDAAILPRIFDAFVQAERGFERSRGGLGLGLALVKGIVELHGGAITAASHGPGAGAEFTVELPIIDIPPQGAIAAQTGSETPKVVAKRMLLIEDNRDSAESLKEYLEILGHDVMIANSGPEGVALAIANPPDVVVCDIGLPGMSGHAVCEELRKVESLSRTLIVALTGHPPEAEGDGNHSGFDHYLLKPVDPQRLAAILQQSRTTRPSS